MAQAKQSKAKQSKAKFRVLWLVVKQKIQLSNERHPLIVACHPALVAGSGAVIYVCGFITRPRNKCGVTKRSAGFTLVELSIVLVIIGFLAGGVIIGKDLIKAAEIRAQISQIQEYNTAINTFKMKYNYLPGDMPPTEATAVGFSNTLPWPDTRDGSLGLGNANGHIEDVYGLLLGGTCNYNRGEPVLFWNDLSSSNLIKPLIKDSVPIAKIGNNNPIVIDDLNGINTFLILSAMSAPNVATGNYGGKALSSQQAYSIDSKIDDGLPQSGKVVNIHVTYGTWYSASPSDGYCNSGTPATYNIAYPDTLSCFLSIKW